MKNQRQILITAALPYANGPIHIGHLVEYLQADFWARSQRHFGNDCAFICADDTHGTPIMIKARERGITPEVLIEEARKDHLQDFSDFQIAFSHYGSTNANSNQILCEEFYQALVAKNHLATKNIEQMYCEHDKMFLPDRFIKGICPKCQAKDQYGDNCDVCGSTYATAEVIEPYCAVCGKTPISKKSEHIFFKLGDFKSFLSEWIPKHTSSDVSKKMMEWFNEDLRDWDISRDKPYFGFEIPNTHGEKFFYVWVDAPMGYVSSTKDWCASNGKSFESYWKSESTEIYHFIGKDIAYFHLLFWPALLKAADYRLPNQVFVHGHLMVNGEKMSKSKGTFIAARTYLKHLSPEYLRYYYATKLNSAVDDLDLNFEDFVSRVNSDLVGKITNLASRGAQMLSKKMDGHMSQPDEAGLTLIHQAQQKKTVIEQLFETREFSKALVEIRTIADLANRYFDEKAPWKTLEANPAETKQVRTTTLNLFRIITIYLTPILPQYSERVAKLLNEKSYTLADVGKILTDTSIGEYEHLATRIDPEAIKAMIEASKTVVTKTPVTKVAEVQKEVSETGLIEIETFNQVDLRIGKILEAETIPESTKLLKLKVELSATDTRQIFAGIKAAYEPASLTNKLVLVVANLKPRKMKFGLSEGMLLAASGEGDKLYLLSPDSGAPVGAKVK